MRYSLPGRVVIRTENAAKPDVQASTVLLDYISQLEGVGSSFDYGCGKLRYADAIMRSTDTLTLVDSEVQIARKQVIRGRTKSIRDIAGRSNRLVAVNVSEFSTSEEQFDRGFCLNVLSVIPFFSARRNALHLIRQRLRAGGMCLFVVQYRNSDFCRMAKLPNARPWRDGFLINSLRGFSFYGLISPQRLTALVIECGFEVIDLKLDDGRVFLMACSRQKPETHIRVVDERNFKCAAGSPHRR